MIFECVLKKPSEHYVLPKEVQVAFAVTVAKSSLANQALNFSGLHSFNYVFCAGRSDKTFSADVKRTQYHIMASYSVGYVCLLHHIAFENGKFGMPVLFKFRRVPRECTNVMAKL